MVVKKLEQKLEQKLEKIFEKDNSSDIGYTNNHGCDCNCSMDM